jgi:hypothetical protein
MQARSWATVEAEDSSRSPSRGERGRGRATAFLPNARNGWSIVWEPGYSKEATRGQRQLLISNAFFFLFFLSELFERKTHSAHVPGTWIFKGGNEWATSTFDFECVFFRKMSHAVVTEHREHTEAGRACAGQRSAGAEASGYKRHRVRGGPRRQQKTHTSLTTAARATRHVMLTARPGVWVRFT